MPSTEKEEVKVREGYLESSPVDLPPDSDDEVLILPVLIPSPISEGFQQQLDKLNYLKQTEVSQTLTQEQKLVMAQLADMGFMSFL